MGCSMCGILHTTYLEDLCTQEEVAVCNTRRRKQFIHSCFHSLVMLSGGYTVSFAKKHKFCCNHFMLFLFGNFSADLEVKMILDMTLHKELWDRNTHVATIRSIHQMLVLLVFIQISFAYSICIVTGHIQT